MQVSGDKGVGIPPVEMGGRTQIVEGPRLRYAHRGRGEIRRRKEAADDPHQVQRMRGGNAPGISG